MTYGSGFLRISFQGSGRLLTLKNAVEFFNLVINCA
jgi:hypothetical protein